MLRKARDAVFRKTRSEAPRAARRSTCTDIGNAWMQGKNPPKTCEGQMYSGNWLYNSCTGSDFRAEGYAAVKC